MLKAAVSPSRHAAIRRWSSALTATLYTLTGKDVESSQNIRRQRVTARSPREVAISYPGQHFCHDKKLFIVRDRVPGEGAAVLFRVAEFVAAVCRKGSGRRRIAGRECPSSGNAIVILASLARLTRAGGYCRWEPDGPCATRESWGLERRIPIAPGSEAVARSGRIFPGNGFSPAWPE